MKRVKVLSIITLIFSSYSTCANTSYPYPEKPLTADQIVHEASYLIIIQNIFSLVQNNHLTPVHPEMKVSLSI